MHETHILETKHVGQYTWMGGGGGLKKCTVCTLMKKLTFLDGPLKDTSNDIFLLHLRYFGK